LFPGTAVKDDAQYTRTKRLSIEHVEILIEIAIGIAIAIDKRQGTIPNPISITISVEPAPTGYLAFI
jgi:hypothetical protein